MFEIKGKYGTAKVYATTVEDACKEQIKDFMNSPVVEGCNVAIMPDCHSGTGACIGFTQEIKNRVNPNMVGVDIGCGMLVLKIKKESGDRIFNKEGLEKLDKSIRQHIPSGLNHRNSLHRFAKKIDLRKLIAKVDENLLYSIGSLGGGNHFIEIDNDENGDYYIVIHSGSRHLGIEVAKYWADKATKSLKYNLEVQKKELIAKLKAEGSEKEIASELNKLPKVNFDKNMAYLEDENVEGYLNDMKIAQQFAKLNREAMLDEICNKMGITENDTVSKFCTIHNYIDIENRILRKGAISLQKDEMALVPINMAFGSLIVKGEGNKDWNSSGPHGAGRLMSRVKAKESLNMEDFRNSMNGIFTTTVCEKNIDEAPMAYKPAAEILENIKGNAEIVSVIKPIYNFKASE